MSGIVVDLQRETLVKEVSVSDLLRKAYFISKKLGIEDSCSWIKNELDGYASLTDVPKYRQIKGQLFVSTPNGGLKNLHVSDANFLKSFSTRPIFGSVASIEAEILSDGNIYFPFPNEFKNKFMEYYRDEFIPLWGCSNTSFISILDSLRNRILDWALELEKNKILGEDMSFTKDEKLSAESIRYQTINNINAPLNNSQLQQNSSGSNQSLQVTSDRYSLDQICSFIKLFDDNRDNFDIDERKLMELESEVQTLKSQIDSPKPKTLIINEAIKSIRNVLEGVTGSLIASNLVANIPALII